ncbi:MAG: hypothetical protein Kow0099_01880 [Candidatus Abyssubacteria bacterium]
MKLKYRPFQQGDEDALSDLFNEVFGWRPVPSYWDWKYFQNPAGPHDAFVAECQGTIVGEIAAVPIRVKIGSEEVIASQTCDIVIAPRYRKGTPFFRLHKMASDEVDRRQWEFVYGISVKTTYRISTKVLGFSGVGPIRRMVKILNPVPFLGQRFRGRILADSLGAIARNGMRMLEWKRLKPSPTIEIRHVESFDKSFDELWERRARDFEIMVVRNSQYLNWRYCANPVQKYTTLAGFRDNALAGFVTLCSRVENGIRRGYILELLAPPDDDELTRSLLCHAILQFGREHVDIANMWLFEHMPGFEISRKLGFRPKESPHDLIIRPHGEQEKGYLSDITRWFLTIGDSDYR